MTQRTVAIIKPGVIERRDIGKILSEIERNPGFRIVAMKWMAFDRYLAEEFYSSHKGTSYFEGLIQHTIMGPCVALILEGDDVVRAWREVIGPTKPAEGEFAFHLRSRFGVDIPDNALHGSDSYEASVVEIGLIFPELINTSGLVFDDKPDIRLKRLSPNAQIPSRGTAGAAGLDVYAVEDVSLPPGAVTKVGTGWNIAVPNRFELQVRARSGNAYKGILVANSPGTVDCDYRGELCVLLLNTTQTAFKIKVGDRIAQILLAPVQDCDIVEVDELDETVRGDKGWGSTGR